MPRKPFDLEERTLRFASEARQFIKQLPRTLSSIEDGRQLIRATGSVGANYIEANEALSKKDFLMRVKICRKEAKGAKYWLRLIEIGDPAFGKTRNDLIREVDELAAIFGAILRNSS